MNTPDICDIKADIENGTDVCENAVIERNLFLTVSEYKRTGKIRIHLSDKAFDIDCFRDCCKSDFMKLDQHEFNSIISGMEDVISKIRQDCINYVEYIIDGDVKFDDENGTYYADLKITPELEKTVAAAVGLNGECLTLEKAHIAYSDNYGLFISDFSFNKDGRCAYPEFNDIIPITGWKEDSLIKEILTGFYGENNMPDELSQLFGEADSGKEYFYKKLEEIRSDAVKIIAAIDEMREMRENPKQTGVQK